jgi:N-methylhydantoinase B/oxoprolinase/acetone carboxylase alpha subunit
LERDVAQALDDVRNEKLTPDHARQQYGVVVNTNTRGIHWQVDDEATERLRAEMRKRDVSMARGT